MKATARMGPTLGAWDMLTQILFLLLGLIIGMIIGFFVYRYFFKSIREGEVTQLVKTEFENMALKLTEASREKLEINSQKSLTTVVKPLEKQIDEFKKKVEEAYSIESRERFLLKSELDRMFKEGELIRLETTNLTRALRGDNKFQGNWGELSLERILESSGLRKGEEYKVQVSDDTVDSSKRQIPDVVIYLPENKHLIIDSKVSFKHYYDYISSDDSKVKEGHLKSHLISIKNHIKNLSEKSYEKMENISSPDFVFLFMAIDPALFLALDAEKSLFNFAWEKNIALVCPSTLQATLRVVAGLWRIERQNKNAMDIALRAGKLYDKFSSLSETLENIERKFLDVQKDYSSALGKLKIGPGNLFSQVESLKKLGAKTSKELKNFEEES